MVNELTSLEIKKFLDFLTDVESRYSIAETSVQEKDHETQDILHRLELYDDPYLIRKKLTDLFPTLRRERRKAKNEAEVLDPIVTWINQNRKTISCLQQLLGEVRKIEKKQDARIYVDRTTIVKDTIS